MSSTRSSASRSTRPPRPTWCRVVVRPGGVPVTLSAWLVGAWDGTPANAAPEEHDEIAWCALADLPPLAHPHVRAAVVDAAGEP